MAEREKKRDNPKPEPKPRPKPRPDKDKALAGNCPECGTAMLGKVLRGGRKERVNIREASEFFCPNCNYRQDRWTGKKLGKKDRGKGKRPPERRLPPGGRRAGDITKDGEPGFIPGVGDGVPDAGRPLDV